MLSADLRSEVELRLAKGESYPLIARNMNVSFNSLRWAKEKWNLPHISQKRGKDHPHWKGGVSVDKLGYRLIYTPGRKSHPYTYEHVLVAEMKLGRRIMRGEHVHHINGLKTDNRDLNLLVVTERQHKLLHGQLQAIAQEMVRSGEIIFSDGNYRRA